MRVITVAAIDAQVGGMDASFDEAQVARAMLAHARQSVVLANAAKLGRMGNVSAITLTDRTDAPLEIIFAEFAAACEGDGSAPDVDELAADPQVDAADGAVAFAAELGAEGFYDLAGIGVGFVGDDGVADDLEGVAEGVVGIGIGAANRSLQLARHAFDG